MIELKSKHAFEDVLFRCNDRIVPDINSNDKTPSWDGELMFYKDGTVDHKKEDLIGRIPLQLKGTYRDSFDGSSTKFDVSVSDINNYSNDDGVLFVVVQIKDIDNYKIFYSSLLPYDLRKIKSELKNGQQTKRIKLKAFPSRYIDGICSLLSGFIIDRKKQGKLLPELCSMEDAFNANIKQLEVVIPADGINTKEDAIKYLLENSIYLYAKPPFTSESFATAKIDLASIIEARNVTLEVDGENLYSQAKQVFTLKDCDTWKFGEGIVLTKNNVKFNITISMDGELEDQIKQIKLFLALANKKSIKIAGIPFNFDESEATFEQIENARNNLEVLTTIQKALDSLGVKKCINVSKLSEVDAKNLIYLSQSINDAIEVPGPEIDHDLSFGMYPVGDLSILVLSQKTGNGNMRVIKDFFGDENVVIEKDDVMYPVSPYVIVDYETMKKCDNFDVARISDSIKKVEYSVPYGERITWFILDLLKLYDDMESKDDTIINIIFDLIDFLESMNEDDKDVYKINRLQAKKRITNLSDDDKKYLFSVKRENESAEFRLAASILLESFDEAKIEYDNLSQEKKEMFDSYPLMNLWK